MSVLVSNNKLCIVIDTCTLIKCYRNKNLTSLSKILRKNNFQIILTDVVLHELCKVLKCTKKFVFIKILTYFRDFKMIGSTKKTINESQILENQFLELHYNDSSILAITKSTSSFLISEDRKLRQTADLSGVPIYNFKQFVRCYS